MGPLEGKAKGLQYEVSGQAFIKGGIHHTDQNKDIPPSA